MMIYSKYDVGPGLLCEHPTSRFMMTARWKHVLRVERQLRKRILACQGLSIHFSHSFEKAGRMPCIYAMDVIALS